MKIVNTLKRTKFQVLAAFIIVILSMLGAVLGYDSFIKDVGFLAAGFLFARKDALQSKSGA
jgi:hypothetical protein